MERELVLEMKDIEKHFHAVKALKGVSFKLYKGEILAIIGENGAGKSTLMKILSGVYPHSTFTGDILLGNNAVKFSNSKDSQNRGIEMIYQEMSMADNLTVAENIMLGFLPRRKMKPFVDFKAMDKSAGEILKYVGLNIDASEIVRNLSTSQKQLMSIAKAVFKKPKILVLDEPTSALTEKDSARLFDILNNLVKDGISCVYISHKLDEVFSISDRIMVLRDGQTINTYEKRTDEKYDANRIIEDMVGRKIEQMYPKVTVAIGNEVLAIKDITEPSTVHGKKKINRVS
jgi:D-xylose transport system ATP-binding protein